MFSEEKLKKMFPVPCEISCGSYVQYSQEIVRIVFEFELYGEPCSVDVQYLKSAEWSEERVVAVAVHQLCNLINEGSRS